MAKVLLENVSLLYPLRVGGRLSYTARPAIRNLNISLVDGDSLGISGPNGAGKTTLLKLICGILHPTSGKIITEGRIGSLLSISAGFHPKASGLENLRFRAKLLGLKKSEVAAAIEDAAETFGLKDVLNNPLETYSSGMRSRLSFAMATSSAPEILVMDEWLGVGDKDFKSIAESRMNTLKENASILVVASHSESLLDRVTKNRIFLEKSDSR